jgi:hypothetical protein
MTLLGLVSLIPVLAAAYGVVLGTVALVTGWRLFRDRSGIRHRRGGQGPPVADTGPDIGGVR